MKEKNEKTRCNWDDNHDKKNPTKKKTKGEKPAFDGNTIKIGYTEWNNADQCQIGHFNLKISILATSWKCVVIIANGL